MSITTASQGRTNLPLQLLDFDLFRAGANQENVSAPHCIRINPRLKNKAATSLPKRPSLI